MISKARFWAQRTRASRLAKQDSWWTMDNWWIRNVESRLGRYPFVAGTAASLVASFLWALLTSRGEDGPTTPLQWWLLGAVPGATLSGLLLAFVWRASRRRAQQAAEEARAAERTARDADDRARMRVSVLSAFLTLASKQPRVWRIHATLFIDGAPVPPDAVVERVEAFVLTLQGERIAELRRIGTTSAQGGQVELACDIPLKLADALRTPKYGVVPRLMLDANMVLSPGSTQVKGTGAFVLQVSGPDPDSPDGIAEDLD